MKLVLLAFTASSGLIYALDSRVIALPRVRIELEAPQAQRSLPTGQDTFRRHMDAPLVISSLLACACCKSVTSR